MGHVLPHSRGQFQTHGYKESKRKSHAKKTSAKKLWTKNCKETCGGQGFKGNICRQTSGEDIAAKKMCKEETYVEELPEKESSKKTLADKWLLEKKIQENNSRKTAAKYCIEKNHVEKRNSRRKTMEIKHLQRTSAATGIKQLQRTFWRKKLQCSKNSGGHSSKTTGAENL